MSAQSLLESDSVFHFQARQYLPVGITKAMNMMFLMDPVLIVLSAIGIIYAEIKRLVYFTKGHSICCLCISHTLDSLFSFY
jgi:hypothetical protein